MEQWCKTIIRLGLEWAGYYYRGVSACHQKELLRWLSNEKILRSAATSEFGSAWLERVAGRADELAEAGYVGPVGANAAGVYGEAQALGLIEIDTGVI